MLDIFNKTLVTDQELEWEVVNPSIKRKIMTYSNDMMLVKVAFETGGIGDVHHHPHLQMSYVAEGVFEVQMGDEKRTLKAGDVFYAPTHVPHGVVCKEAGMLIDIFNPHREDFIKK